MSPAHLKLVQLHQKLTQEISPALVNKCKRQVAGSVAASAGVACFAFGCAVLIRPDVLLSLRVGLGTFCVFLGICTVVSTLQVADWLGKQEGLSEN